MPLVSLAHTEVEKSTKANEEKGHFLLVSIPSLSFIEWPLTYEESSHPFLSDLMKKGIPGSMNVRNAYRGLASMYLTMGAGAPALATEAMQAYKQSERCNGTSSGTLYLRYTGKRTNAEVVIPQYAGATILNEEKPYFPNPGMLGQLLAEAGIERQVIGSLDQFSHKASINQVAETFDACTQQYHARLAPLLLMDEQGTIPRGSFAQTLYQVDDRRPFGIRTDYHAYFAEIKDHLQADTSDAAVMMLELGDLHRLYIEKDFHTPHHFSEIKHEILSEMGDFINLLIAQLRSNDRLLVLSPSYPKEAAEERLMLTPLIMFSPEMADQSSQYLLTSDSTRRPGIVSYADIAPTILAHFGIPKPLEMKGNPIFPTTILKDIKTAHKSESPPRSFNIYKLSQDQLKASSIYKLRVYFLYGFAIYEVLVLIAGLLSATRIFVFNMSWLNFFLHSLIWAPVVMLWSSWLSASQLIHAAFIVAITLVLSFISSRKRPLNALISIGAVTVFSILFDGIIGNPWMKYSILGYDPMIGARFYGIGNEYMGVLIGAAFLLIAVSLQYFLDDWHKHLEHTRDSRIRIHRRKRWLRIGFLGATVLLICLLGYMMHPQLGTNAGGAITILLAGAWLWLRLFGIVYDKTIPMRQILWISLGTLTIAGLCFIIVNVTYTGTPSSKSHIGVALEHMLAGNYEQIHGIIVRKLQMNWRLINISAWSKVFITSLLVLVVGLIRPWGVFKIWMQKSPLLVTGFAAIIIGALIALVFNDSGIVAAATMMVYAAVPMLIVQLRR